VFRRVYLGTSPYIKAVSFVVRRCPNGLALTGGAENIDGDANPAAMIYDILISPASENGLGLPVGFLDVAAFRSVGQTLATEGLGLSMLQDRGTTAKDLVLEILRHIDGVIYVEPTTGLLTIRLIRNDYDAEPDIQLNVRPGSARRVRLPDAARGTGRPRFKTGFYGGASGCLVDLGPADLTWIPPSQGRAPQSVEPAVWHLLQSDVVGRDAARVLGLTDGSPRSSATRTSCAPCFRASTTTWSPSRCWRTTATG